jgi:hypothetical protein
MEALDDNQTTAQVLLGIDSLAKEQKASIVSELKNSVRVISMNLANAKQNAATLALAHQSEVLALRTENELMKSAIQHHEAERLMHAQEELFATTLEAFGQRPPVPLQMMVERVQHIMPSKTTEEIQQLVVEGLYSLHTARELKFMQMQKAFRSEMDIMNATMEAAQSEMANEVTSIRADLTEAKNLHLLFKRKYNFLRTHLLEHFHITDFPDLFSGDNDAE